MLGRICSVNSSTLIINCRWASSHHDHNEPNVEHTTGWPKPSERSRLKPYTREEVNHRLQSIYLSDEKKEKILDLEGWLFGKKVIYLRSDRPWYEHLPSSSKYMFGERVSYLSHFTKCYLK